MAGFPASDGDQTTPELATTSDAGATRALAILLRLTPCLDLHKRAGDVDRHPKRGMLCFALDLFIRCLAVLLLIAIVAAVAWKTLAPLPSPMR